MSEKFPGGVEIHGPITPEFAQILTRDAVDFVAFLCRGFEPHRQELLAARAARQKEFDAGKMPDFLPQTAQIRSSEWNIAAQPADMLDRRVEITGPTDSLVINLTWKGGEQGKPYIEVSFGPLEASKTGK